MYKSHLTDIFLTVSPGETTFEELMPGSSMEDLGHAISLFIETRMEEKFPELAKAHAYFVAQTMGGNEDARQVKEEYQLSDDDVQAIMQDSTLLYKLGRITRISLSFNDITSADQLDVAFQDLEGMCLEYDMATPDELMTLITDIRLDIETSERGMVEELKAELQNLGVSTTEMERRMKEMGVDPPQDTGDDFVIKPGAERKRLK